MKPIKILKNILYYLTITAMLLLCFTLGRAAILKQQPELFGYKFFIVLTGSMSPTIQVGDLIIDKIMPPEDIKVGDVITFGNQDGSSITTHRVKDIQTGEELEFTTQGDANNIQDPNPVTKDQLIGKVVYWIPNLGSTIQFIQQNLILLIASGLAFIFGCSILISNLKREKTN